MFRGTGQWALTLGLLVALVVGLRLILGEWNWWLTGLGALALVASSVWDGRARRDRSTRPGDGRRGR